MYSKWRAMPTHMTESTSPEQPKKRKLRHPRASNACSFCRKRKVRCTGTQPCDVCVREDIRCEYPTGLSASALSPSNDGTYGPKISMHGVFNNKTSLPTKSSNESSESSRASSSYNDAAHPRRDSMDPPQAFVHGNHIGSTSGISFLYGQWNKVQNPDKTGEAEVIIYQAPLVSYGDLPRHGLEKLSVLSEPYFTVEQINGLLDRYFQYISPTYRFLHHPTVKSWATKYATQDHQITAAQKAVVLLVCAQTLLHSPVSSGVAHIGNGDIELSMVCSENAKSLLDKEPGPPSLASVQARLAMCLYLLSTFRLNECRYCFSFAVSVITALGIHRCQSSLSSRINIVDTECQKRTFWSMYVLDGYLSVMLGRPRLIRDEDVDQPLPQNVSDSDLISSDSIDDLPLHGDLEAFIAHAKLAKLMARGNDLLYPLHSVTNDQLLERSNNMLDALAEWQEGLPEFLKPKGKTMTGQRTFERQNNILKLAVAHVRILSTRRCLLVNLGHADANPFPLSQDAQAKRSIKECISAIFTILEAVETLIAHGQCYGSFWSTQYIAMVAISTLYVLLIQGVRRALPGDMESFLNVDDCMDKAKRCHDHLATLPPPGSQAERHHVLLARLRFKAEKELIRRNTRRVPTDTILAHKQNTARGSHSHSIVHQDTTIMSHLNENNDDINENNNEDNNISSASVQTLLTAESFVSQMDDNFTIVDHDGFNDMSIFSTILTPNSNSDTSLQYILDLGWESLDTIGASTMRGNMYAFQPS